MTQLVVKTQRKYNILITHGFGQFDCPVGEKVCIVSDSNVAPLYLDAVLSAFQDKQTYSFVIPSGESSKCARQYLAILSFLAQNAFSRKDTVVALGGGVVGDLAGFCAATYMRGIDFVQIPTTLLAMIDSSVGGKTGIDLAEGKNLVGAFHQPKYVYINLDTLNTLPVREMDNGKGELVKYAFLSNTVTKADLTGPVTEQLVAKCLAIKAEIVESDEKESGRRMLLNLGHTVGHAIETLSQFSLPHGLCVAKGIASAISVSQKMYSLSDKKAKEMYSLLNAVGLDTALPFDKQQIVSAVAHDKKSSSGSVNFVTLADIGDCRIEKIAQKDLLNLL